MDGDMARTVKVMIVDDEAHIRRYIATLTSTISGVEVIGEAENGEEALDNYSTLHPDVILLDINMPKKNGLEVLESIRSQDSETSVVILTSLSSVEVVKKALELHAAQYVLKDSPPEKIRDAIKNVCFHKLRSEDQGYLP